MYDVMSNDNMYDGTISGQIGTYLNSQIGTLRFVNSASCITKYSNNKIFI